MLDKNLVLFDHPILEGDQHAEYLLELLELQAEFISKYIIKVEAPKVDGKHDDFSDALVRMVWCATQNANKQHAILGHRRGVPQYAGNNSRFGRTPKMAGRRGVTSRAIPKKNRR